MKSNSLPQGGSVATLHDKQTATPRQTKYRVISGRGGARYGVADHLGGIVYDLLDSRAEATAIKNILNKGIGPGWMAVSDALAADPKTRKWAEGGAGMKTPTSKDPQAQAETKHTPIRYSYMRQELGRRGGGGALQVNLSKLNFFLLPFSEENLGHARLITSAPELLEALKAIQEWGNKNLDIEENSVPYFYGKYSPEAGAVLAKVDAAIRKAEKQP